MNLQLLLACAFLFLSTPAFSAEENFIVINGLTNKTVSKLGNQINEQITPCSTFKIVLSLMGYDAKVLQDLQNPVWEFHKGYDDFLESWKTSQTPQSWMKNSCVWYSKVIAHELGMEKVKTYLALLKYGNQNMSSGLKKAWLSSSLKVSPKEQVFLIQKLVQEKLPLSLHAMQMTKSLLFLEDLPDGWKLFGKTGWGDLTHELDPNNIEVGWFVGWVEKDNQFFPFAYNIREKKINLPKRIPRVKELLKKSSIL